MSGSALQPRATAGSSDLMLLFWNAFDAYKANTSQPNLADPLPAALVLGGSITNQDFDTIFSNQQPVSTVYVKEGCSLGNFTAGTIGFEIITDTYGLTLDLAYARQASVTLSTTGLTGLALTARRDTALSYIDPAALFGLHTEVGVDFGTYSNGQKTTTVYTGSDLTTRAVAPFATAHRLYLDIRNEFGRSYNFSGSYGTAGLDLGLGGQYQTYATQGWPIHYVDLSTTSSGTTVQLQLRLDNNPNPELYCEAGRYGGPAQPLGPCFAPAADLANLGNGWTHQLPFYVAGNMASYLKFHYYRPAQLTSLPDTVLKRQHRLDNLFDLSHLPAAATTVPVAHAYVPEPVLVKGQRLDSTDTYTYVAASGTYASTDRAVCYLQERHAPENPARIDFYQPNATGTTSPGLFDDVRAGFLRTQVALAATPVTEAGGTPTVQVADIYAYSGTPSYRESLNLLCLTATELQALASAPGLSPMHPRYLVFTDTTPAGGLADDTGDACTQYNVQVQGLDNAGHRAYAIPTPAVTVYASAAGFVLASAGLSDPFATTPPKPVTYQRDPEEEIGTRRYQIGSKDSLEDTFISRAPSIQKIVNDFIKSLTDVKSTTPNGITQLRTIVTAAGKALFLAAVAYVKEGVAATSSHDPDDRPAYWARIKMAVTLKSHLLFANSDNLETNTKGESNSKVKPPSSLAKLVRRFEETSRNYTGIDFSATPVGARKVLITGYDPFQLEDVGQYQLNPSDIIAYALHGTTLVDEKNKKVGYIQAMVFPVRYRDFDSSTVDHIGTLEGTGVAERYIGPFISSVYMIVTISQGGRGLPARDPKNRYNDIEQYATNRRGGAVDNLGDTRPKNSTSMPVVAVTPTQSDNMEWLETTLTLAPNMLNPPATLHRSYIIDFPSKPKGVGDLPPVFKKLSPKGIMIEGSGSNYLSNEIFYRVARMREFQCPTLLSGHLHTPVIVADPDKNGLDVSFPSKFQFDVVRTVITDTRTILTNGVA